MNRKLLLLLALLVLGNFLISKNTYASTQPNSSTCTGTLITTAINTTCSGSQDFPDDTNGAVPVDIMSVSGDGIQGTNGSLNVYARYQPQFISAYIDSNNIPWIAGVASSQIEDTFSLYSTVVQITYYDDQDTTCGATNQLDLSQDLSSYTYDCGDFKPKFFGLFNSDSGKYFFFGKIEQPVATTTTMQPVSDNHFVIIAGAFMSIYAMWLIISLFKKKI